MTAATNDLLIMYTYGGDADMNGKLDGDDYMKLDQGFGNQTTFNWVNGDFNYDGKINGDDYFILDSNIGRQGTQFPGSGGIDGVAAAGGLGISAVPEPASIGLLGVAATALLGRRRRRIA